VQGLLEEALARIAGHAVVVRGAGRTDAGVHARGQHASFWWDHPTRDTKLVAALCALLPDDMGVVSVVDKGDDFDAKRDSLGKRYVYRIFTAPFRPLFDRAIVWHRRCPLDIEKMRAGAAHLVGELDFESFRNAGCQEMHARRCVWLIDVNQSDQIVTVEVRGNAFVRGMVRAITGTLVEVGRGRFKPQRVLDILLACDRRQAGMTAPARGLTLEEVYYVEDQARAAIPDWASWPGFRR
jgi:tRNA pseudouridine38-40 synthase